MRMLGPECPYCGHLCLASGSDGLLYDQSTLEYDCGECCKTFAVTVLISYSWVSKTVEERDTGLQALSELAAEAQRLDMGY